MTAPAIAPVPYGQFVADVASLAAAIAAEAWVPDHLVGIGRGGLVPGVYLSHRLRIPLVSLDHSAGVAAFGAALVPALAAMTRDGARLLLVDDINDCGRTIAAVRARLAEHDAAEEGVRVAVLLDNVRSPSRVDYRARTIDRAEDRRWFVFPWEQMADRAAILAEATHPDRLA